MTDPNFIILYVNDVPASVALYADLLDKQPIDAAPTFAMFVLDSGLKLGLWNKQGVQPSATAVGGSELGFAVADNAAVDARYSAWQKRGLAIAQVPTAMDFGYTFVALDHDGHRLRVFSPAAE